MSLGAFNWRSMKYPGSGDLGSGRVDRPDYRKTADKWRGAAVRGRKLSSKLRSDWVAFAKRSGVWPEDVEKGWSYMTRGTLREAISELRQALSEATSWWGYSVPNLHMIKTPYNPGPGLGFHTRSADKVWKVAKEVADQFPKAKTGEIVKRAIDKAGVLVTELTPEDSKLLDMAVNWYLAGKSGGMEQPEPIRSGNRIGGMPGGPFRQSGRKGAP